MRFINPQTSYVETRSAPWLWAFLFGGLYFAFAGIWAPVLIWFALAIVLYASMGAPATILMFGIALIYGAMAPSLVRRSYLRKGWTEAPGDASDAEISSQYRKCPFCAEMIRREAIKCKHCGSELPPVAAVASAPESSTAAVPYDAASVIRKRKARLELE